MKSKEWLWFERKIERDAKAQNITYRKIPEKFVNVYRGHPIQKKVCYDGILSLDGRFVSLDAKSCNVRTFNLKSNCFAPKKIHQFNALVDDHNNGNISGLLINFVAYKLISWVPIEIIADIFFKKKPIKSLKPDFPGIRSQEAKGLIDFKRLCLGPEVSHESS